MRSLRALMPYILPRWLLAAGLLLAHALAGIAPAAAWTDAGVPGHATLPIAGEPSFVALAGNARVLAVATTFTPGVTVIEPDTGAVLARIELPAKPAALAVNGAGTRAYLAIGTAGEIRVLDLVSRTTVGSFNLGGEPVALALSPDERELLVADKSRRRIVGIDPASGAVLRTRALDKAPTGMALGDGGTRVLVALRGELVTLAIATLAEQSRTTVGDDIRELSWWDAGGVALAVGKRNDALTLVRPGQSSPAASVRLDGDPERLGVDQTGSRAFVTTRDDVSVNRVDLSRPGLDGRYPLPSRAAGLAFDAGARVLYIAQPQDNRLLRLDPEQTSLVGVLELRKRLRDLVVNERTHQAIAIADKADELSRIQLGDRTVQVLGLPYRPKRIAVDATLDLAVVAVSHARHELMFVDLAATPPALQPAQIDLVNEVKALAVDPVRNLTVIVTGGRNVHVVDNKTRTLLGTFRGPDDYEALAISSKRGVAYLATDNGKLAVFDLASRTIVQTVALSVSADALGVDDALNLAVLADDRQSVVMLLNLETLALAGAYQVAKHPEALAVDPVLHRAVILSRVSGEVALLDLQTGTLQRPFALLEKPFAVAISSRYNQALVLTAERDEISFVQLPNPLPVLERISPDRADAGAAALTLTVEGKGFVDASRVRFGAVTLATKYVDATRLTAQVPASELASGREVPVTVRNPGPGGGDSAALPFRIGAPAPVLASVAPPSLVANGQPQGLTLLGTGFGTGATVVFGATPVIPAAVGPTQIGATIPGAALAAPGIVNVAVRNPDGQVSNALPVTVTVAAPSIASIDPTQGRVGTAVSINGANLDAAQVTFAAANAGRIAGTVVSTTATRVVVTVPQGAVTGTLRVTTPNGTAESGVFTVLVEQDFALMASPSQLKLPQGGAASVSLQLTDLGTRPFSGLAALSVSGLPSGVTAVFTPPSLSLAQTGSLALRAGATAQPGTSTATITATAPGGLVKTAQVAVTVESAQGVTAVTGRFVDEGGRGVAGVIVRVDNGPQTATDAGGNFTLAGVPPGDATLRFDATPANPLYPIWPYTAKVAAGQVLAIPDWTLKTPPPPERFTPMANAAQDQVVTDPRFPGFSVTLPAGTAIVGWDGVPKTRIAIEKVEIEKLPVPPPPVPTRSAYQLFFGTPSGGIPSKPIPVTLPNDLDMDPGQKADIWYFDGSPMGGDGLWKKAGEGTVSADGLRIIMDPGQGVPRFCGVCGLLCASAQVPPAGPQPAPPDPGKDKDPIKPCPDPGPGSGPPMISDIWGATINLFTGQEMPQATDLSCGGGMAMGLSRNYNPVDAFNKVAGTAGSLGLGWVLNYDVSLLPFEGPQKRIVLPGNIRVNFTLQPDGTYINGDDSRFEGAVMRATNVAANLWEVKFKDGRLWRFAPFPGVTGFIRGGPPLFLTERLDAFGNTLTIDRESNGRIRRVGIPGRGITFNYGANGFVSELRDPIGRTVKYTYTAADRIETVTDPEGGVTRYTYVDDSEFPAYPACPQPGTGGVRLKSTQFPGKAQPIVQHYGAGRRVLRETFEDGTELRTSYRLAGACVTNVSSPGVRCTGPTCPDTDSWENHQAGWRIIGGQVIASIATDANGNTTTRRYNARGKIIEVIDADGQSTRMTRDANQRIVETVDPLGRTWKYAYDAKGNLVEETDPLARWMRYEYDPVWNRPTSISRPFEGGTVTNRLAYDTAGGNVVSATDPLGQQTAFAYNAQGRLERITDPAGKSLSMGYNTAGDLVSLKDPLANQTRFVTDPVGRTVQQVNALGQAVRVDYNGIDQVVRVTDAAQRVSQYAYDSAQRLASVQNPNGVRVAAYAYDDADRLIRRTDAKLLDASFRYDAAGRLIEVVDRAGRRYALSYDRSDQVVEITRPDGQTRMAYDAVGRRILVEDESGRIAFEYDSVDRLVRERVETGPERSEIEYAYDALDRLVRRTVIVNGAAPEVTEYAYDVAGRMTEMRFRGKVTRMAYDSAGRLVRRELPNGVVTNLAFDDASRLTQIRYTGASGALLEQVSYTYDPLGRRVGRTGPAVLADTPMSATYDEADRLTALTLIGTGPNGTDERFVFSYDANGNLLRKQKEGVSDETTFTWDSRNRLTAISAPAYRASFAYDALGRRIAKTITPQPAGAPVTTRFVYDGAQAIAEIRDGQAAHLLTAGIDELIARYGAGGERIALLDALGSVLALTRADGSIATRYTYSTYGETTRSGEADPNASQYTGREADETGLYYYRARYYDPQLKRFVSEDPIGLAGGLNQYGYVNADPVNLTDPSGTVAFVAFLIPVGQAYMRCVAQCGTLATVADFVQKGCTDPVENLKDCAWECADPTSYVGGGARGVHRIKPNGGVARPHGGAAHNRAIDQRAKALQSDPEVSNIRKNQRQVDVNGNTVGRNVPDLQYDKQGCHHCVEYDTVPRNSVRHGEVIRANDPNTRIELNQL